MTDAARRQNVRSDDGTGGGQPIEMEGVRPFDVLKPVDAKTRRAMLRHMLVARGIDDEARRLENQGALDLWLSCRGQEAAQVGSAMAVGDEAVIFPSYRE